MGIFSLGIKGIARRVGKAFVFGSKGVKATKAAAKAVSKPVPVGQVAASVTEAKPVGFFERLAKMHSDPNYQAYKDTFNEGLPFDHYMYLY